MEIFAALRHVCRIHFCKILCSIKDEGDAEDSGSDTEELLPTKIMSTILKFPTTRTTGRTILCDTLELFMMF